MSSQDLLQETIEFLQAYLRINTTNPPGNEGKSAEFLRRVLEGHGFQTTVQDLGEGRANLSARLSGRETGPGLGLLHHMDVVPVEEGQWTMDPFAGGIRDRYLYGRGAVDIKSKGAVDLWSLLDRRRKGWTPRHDIVFLAVADEEANSIGIRRLLSERPDLLHGIGTVLDEGGCVTCDPGGINPRVEVTFGEKTALWLQLDFSGEPGHGSVPHPDSAAHRAVRAAARLITPEPCNLLPELRPWLTNILQNRGYAPNDLEQALADANLAAMLRDTINLTGMNGGEKVNVVPGQIQLRLDCRLLPTTDPDQFLDHLLRKAAEPGIQVTILERTEATSSTIESPLIQQLQQVSARIFPGIPFTPRILAGATDSAVLRQAGFLSYGFEPFLFPPEELARVHGHDERISVENIQTGLEFMDALLTLMD